MQHNLLLKGGGERGRESEMLRFEDKPTRVDMFTDDHDHHQLNFN